MREAIGSTFLFNLMIIFIFFFAAFLAIAINYSQAFSVKNKVINMIEQYEGTSREAQNEIFNQINTYGYYREKNCECGTDLSCSRINEKVDGGTIQNINGTPLKGLCVRKFTTGANNTDVYYSVTTYVGFNLPFIGNLITFPVKGETKIITNPQD